MGKNKQNNKGQNKISYKKAGKSAKISKCKSVLGGECYSVTIALQSPIHLSSGKADVNVDADVVHDAVGLPYFPAKRFKGLLYESMLEVAEMMTDEAANLAYQSIQELFQRVPNAKVNMLLHDFYLYPQDEYEKVCRSWAYLQEKYAEIVRPETVLEGYTTLRYQTKIDEESGTASDTSFHNMRVVDAGQSFVGTIELLDAEARHRNMLYLGLKNLRRAGLKRNRGFGHITCNIDGLGIDLATALAKEAE